MNLSVLGYFFKWLILALPSERFLLRFSRRLLFSLIYKLSFDSSLFKFLSANLSVFVFPRIVFLLSISILVVWLISFPLFLAGRHLFWFELIIWVMVSFEVYTFYISWLVTFKNAVDITLILCYIALVIDFFLIINILFLFLYVCSSMRALIGL